MDFITTARFILDTSTHFSQHFTMKLVDCSTECSDHCIWAKSLINVYYYYYCCCCCSSCSYIGVIFLAGDLLPLVFSNFRSASSTLFSRFVYLPQTTDFTSRLGWRKVLWSCRVDFLRGVGATSCCRQWLLSDFNYSALAALYIPSS